MLPLITIIIPVKPGGYVRSLEPLGAADYPRELMQVIVAEGRQPSVQRNTASRLAKGDIIFFLDDDSVIPPGLFREVVKRFEDPNVSVVGGPIITPETDSLLQKSFGLALSSIFGGASVRARYKKLGPERDATENDLILANMSFRREVFTGAGGFNENLYPNEENELMNKLNDAGHIFRYVPDTFLFRSQRPNYKAYCRQVFTYGRGRMDQNYAHPEGFRPLHAAPAAFLLYTLSLPFAAALPLPLLHNIIYFLPALLYLTMCFGFSAASAAEAKNPLFLPLMPLMFLTLHLGYGAGFIWGGIKGIFKDKNAPRPKVEVTIREVQL